MGSKLESRVSRLAKNPIGMGIAAAAASSTMLYFGTGLHPLWWLTWFATLPVLWVSPRVRARSAFGIATLSWFLGSMNLWPYLLRSIRLPIILVVILSTVPACIFGLAVLLFQRFARRGALWKAALIVPAVWVSFEYLIAFASPHGTFGNLGYTQMDCLPVLQIVSVTGIWGISFCMFLFQATLAAGLNARANCAQRTRLVKYVAIFLAAMLAYGSWRLNATPAPKQSVRVGLVAAGWENPYIQGSGASLELIQGYSEQVARLAAQGARMIVLPEKIMVVSDPTTARFDDLFEAAAKAARANVVVGLDRGSETRRSNEARLYTPEGTLVAIYDKHHLVPQFEDVDEPGTKIAVMRQPSGIWGLEICKDMDFPRLSRQYGAEGVGLLIVPAWDFVADGWLHDRMAVMRGVESGFTIVRSASEGRLTVSDNRGRVLAETGSERAIFSSLLATAPVRHDETPYLRWGDWFAWANIAGLLAIIIFKR